MEKEKRPGVNIGGGDQDGWGGFEYKIITVKSKMKRGPFQETSWGLEYGQAPFPGPGRSQAWNKHVLDWKRERVERAMSCGLEGAHWWWCQRKSAAVPPSWDW
jgi:hypothetical protein